MEIEELFPARPSPVKVTPEDFHINMANAASTSRQRLPQAVTGPVATGQGFFTPVANAQNGTFEWKPDPFQPFRLGVPQTGRESLYVEA